MEAAARPRHMDALRAHVEHLQAEGHGDHLEIVEPKDMTRVLGTKIYHGGMIDWRSGHLHPLNLCLGEARAAGGLGVKIFEDSAVVAMGGGAKAHAQTREGRVQAKHVVLAGDTGHAFERGRLRGLQFPTGSYIIATEPLSQSVALEINPRDLAVADGNIVSRLLPSLRRPADAVRGALQLFEPRSARSCPGAAPATGRDFQLADTSIAYAWGGRIGIVLTRVPAIGRLEPNLYYLQGYCGHGVNATHIAARDRFGRYVRDDGKVRSVRWSPPVASAGGTVGG